MLLWHRAWVCFGLHGSRHVVLVPPLYFNVCVLVEEGERPTEGGNQHQIHTK